MYLPVCVYVYEKVLEVVFCVTPLFISQISKDVLLVVAIKLTVNGAHPLIGVYEKLPVGPYTFIIFASESLQPFIVSPYNLAV
jgi:hypothetical protein